MSNLRTVTDQMGREVVFPFPPRRIISLVPSQTEFLFDINAPLVGRTKFCIHPQPDVKSIPVAGGTKKFHFDKIRELQPDLIIGNKEENYKEGIEALAQEFPVWMSDIFTLEDSREMMKQLGILSDREEEATRIITDCQEALEKVKGNFTGKVIYLIWKDPWITVGSNTFIDHLLHFLGYENLIKESRYPELSVEQIAALNPDKILLSSEPFPFKEKHLDMAEGHWPTVSCELVDGELHSWYGSRLRNWSH